MLTVWPDPLSSLERSTRWQKLAGGSEHGSAVWRFLWSGDARTEARLVLVWRESIDRSGAVCGLARKDWSGSVSGAEARAGRSVCLTTVWRCWSVLVGVADFTKFTKTVASYNGGSRHRHRPSWQSNFIKLEAVGGACYKL